MTTATTAYRDYVLDEFANSLKDDEVKESRLTARKQMARALCREGHSRSAQPTTFQHYFVVLFDAEPRSWVELVPALKEPESELQIFVAHPPIKTRQVKVRITGRTKGVPNPILPNFGQ